MVVVLGIVFGCLFGLCSCFGRQLLGCRWKMSLRGSLSGGVCLEDVFWCVCVRLCSCLGSCLRGGLGWKVSWGDNGVFAFALGDLFDVL